MDRLKYMLSGNRHRIVQSIMKHLAQSPEGLTRKQILESVIGRRQTVRHTLLSLLREEQISRSGYGTRCFPFRYHFNSHHCKERMPTNEVTVVEDPIHSEREEFTL